MTEPTATQRDVMRKLFRTYGDHEDVVCTAYAEAELAGKVARKSNWRSESADDYARRLWKDGKAKGWLS